MRLSAKYERAEVIGGLTLIHPRLNISTFDLSLQNTPTRLYLA